MSPLPRVYNPTPPKKGPGSAFIGTSLAKNRRRRRRKTRQSQRETHAKSTVDEMATTTDVLTSIGPKFPPSISKDISREKQFVGQDLLNWQEENAPVSNKCSKMKDSATKTFSQKPALVEKANHCATTKLGPDLPFSRNAIAFDTRVLETKESAGEGSKVCKNYEDFVRTLLARGSCPTLLGMTYPSTKPLQKSFKTSNIVEIQTMDLVTDADSLKKKINDNTPILSKVVIRPPNSKISSVPKALGAKNSWKVISDLVKSIKTKDASRESSEYRTPLCITILTSDLGFFCDTNAAVHAEQFGCFWDRLSPFFHDSSIGCIRIIVAKTRGLALQCGESSKESNDGNMSTDSLTNDQLRTHETAVAKCLHAIQMTLSDRAEEEFQKSSRASADKLCAPVNISISSVENCFVGYSRLSRQWIRDSLFANATRRRLDLDLPETGDGAALVSFDVSYQTFPFAINTPESKRLLADLQLLCDSKMKIVQLVPIASIDACLLFGVPMSLRAAFFDDFDQFTQMEVLTRSLFRHLYERQLALFVSSTAVGGSPECNLHGLFNNKSEQTFILMAQELPGSMNLRPHSGILYRYALANQLVAEATIRATTSSFHEEMESQYMDYVDRSLDCLDCKPVNPLYMKAKATVLPLTTEEPLTFPQVSSMSTRNHSTETFVPKMQEGSPFVPKEKVGDNKIRALDSSPTKSNASGPNKAEHDVGGEFATPGMALSMSSPPTSPDSIWNDKIGVGSRAPRLTQDDDEGASEGETFASF